jgi:hypothetical protein
MGQGEYVVGLEPGTHRVEGRDVCRAAKTLTVLQPGEARDYDLEVGALPDAAAVADFQAEVKTLSAGRKPRYARNVRPT